MPGLARITATALGLMGGLVASQGPEYAQQYRQRLGGAIDELRRVVERFEADAHAAGDNREGALERLAGNPDAFVRRHGGSLRETFARLDALERQRQAFADAGRFERLLVLVREADAMIAQAAYRDFEPAVPATEEGVVSAAVGFAAAWGATLLLLKGGGRLFRRRRAGAPAA